MNPGKRYTHLFFDLDNTLWDFNANAYHAMQIVFTCYEKHLSKVRFPDFFHTYTVINKRLWDCYHQGKMIKSQIMRLRFQFTFDELQIRNIDPVEMNNLYQVEMSKQIRLVDGTENLLDYLKTKGYSLFIITNGYARIQHTKLENSGIKKYFRKIYISEEIKSAKPARKMFEYALKSSNAKKAGCLMIGDNYKTDIAGALDFGMDAMLLELAGIKKNNSSFNQNYRCKNYYKVHSLPDIQLII